MSVHHDDDPPVIQPSLLFSSEQWMVFRMTWPTLLVWSLVIIGISRVLP